MKRIVLVSAVLLLLGTAAFAEITWGGSGRLVLVPFGIRGENSDKDVPAATYFGAENPWSGNGPRIGLSLTGKREQGNMGFNLAFAVEHQSGEFVPAIDDGAANIWLKPFGGALETLTGTFGMFNVDKLRFKYAGSGMGFHNYVSYVRTDLADEDTTFRRFRGSGFGSHLSYELVEGLWLGVGFGSVGDSRSFAGEFKEDGFINALKDTQVGAGYTIKDIGFIRAQWVGFVTKEWAETSKAETETVWVQDTPSDPASGKWETKTTAAKYDWVNKSLDKPLGGTGDAGKIQAAFNLTAIPGVSVDLGISVPLADEKDYWNDLAKTTKTKTVKTQDDYVVSIGADITAPMPFRLWTVISAKFGGYTETTTPGTPTETIKKGTDVAVMLNPWYYLTDSLILSADIFLDTRFGSDEAPIVPDSDPTMNPAADAKNNYLDLGFGLYVRKNIAGGDVRAGVTLKLPGGDAHEGAKPQFFIPIMFNYGF
ncbi:MAG: hypothetical protein LBK43_06145 [Treponema sp.]|nr:hypothetical protein [Treponema sp.]